MLLSLTKNVARLFFIFALFPFVSFGTNGMDSQPHYIFLAFLAFILFAFNGLVFRKALLLQFFVFFGLIFILMVILLTLFLTTTNFDFLFIRAIASYSAFFITLIASIIYFERFGIPVKTIVIANIIYIFAALIQWFFGGLVLDFLVISNTSTDPSMKAGAISLTPEHTMFGIVLYFFSWIHFVIYDYKPPKLVALLIIINILSIFFLAKSSMVVVFLVVSAFVFLIRNIKQKVNLKLILIPVILVPIVLYVYILILPTSRFHNLFHIGSQAAGGGLFDQLSELIFIDGSINDRLLNVIFPYYGFVFNYGMPGGLHSFYDMSIILVEYFDGYFWAGLGSNKILSFIGAFIYELGVIGIISILYIYWFVKDNNNPNSFFELILLFIVLNSAIAVAFSLVPILIAIMYYKKSNPPSRSQNYDP